MTTFNTQFPFVLITSIIRSPIGPGIDALVMAALDDKTIYGALRLWGAVSFGICSLLGGYLTSAPHLHKDGDSPFIILFYAYAMASVLSGYIILCLIYEDTNRKSVDVVAELKHVDSTATDVSAISASSDSELIPQPDEEAQNRGRRAGREHKVNANIVSALLQVVRDKPIILLFALVVFLSGFGAGAIDSYLFLRLKELGGSGLVMGLGRFITCAAEVPMFHVAGAMQKNYGTWPMIALTQLAFVVRFVYYILLRNPWAVLPCEALNGLTFAVTWSVSCTYANEVAPPGCHAVVQALLEGLHFGFGCGVGSLVGGYIYEYYGAVRVFEVCAVLSALSTVLAMLAWRFCSRVEPTVDDGLNVSSGRSSVVPKQPTRVGNQYIMLEMADAEDDPAQRTEL
jgi:MFS family permease